MPNYRSTRAAWQPTSPPLTVGIEHLGWERYSVKARMVFPPAVTTAIVTGRETRTPRPERGSDRRATALGAAPLTPSWHAERTPDAPAIVMGTSGAFVTYAPLADRSSRLRPPP